MDVSKIGQAVITLKMQLRRELGLSLLRTRTANILKESETSDRKCESNVLVFRILPGHKITGLACQPRLALAYLGYLKNKGF
jgi:hypothetical protein